MPPQQGHTLLDLVDDGLDLGTHVRAPVIDRGDERAAPIVDARGARRANGAAGGPY
jgi:hypothetical protein